MISSLLVLHVIVVLLLVGIILIQKSEGGIGLGTGGGGAGGMFTARGAANFLTRATSVLAAIFLTNSLLMGAITSSQIKKSSSFLQKKIASQ